MILFISCHSRSYLKTIYTSTKSRSTILLHDTLRHGRRTKTSKRTLDSMGLLFASLLTRKRHGRETGGQINCETDVLTLQPHKL